jgi:hypothetical protein
MSEQIILDALKNELKKAKSAEKRIKGKVSAYMTAGSDIIDARQAASKLMEKPIDKEGLAELEKLADIEKKALKAIKVDAVKLFDAEFKAESKVRDIAQEIQRIEFRQSIRRGE